MKTELDVDEDGEPGTREPNEANQEHENRTRRTRSFRPPPPFLLEKGIIGGKRKERERGLNSHHVGGCLQIYSTKAESQWIVAHRPLSQKRLTIPRPLLKSFTMDLFPRLLPILLNPSQQVFTLPRGPKCMIFAFPLLLYKITSVGRKISAYSAWIRA